MCFYILEIPEIEEDLEGEELDEEENQQRQMETEVAYLKPNLGRNQKGGGLKFHCIFPLQLI